MCVCVYTVTWLWKECASFENDSRVPVVRVLRPCPSVILENVKTPWRWNRQAWTAREMVRGKERGKASQRFPSRRQEEGYAIKKSKKTKRKRSRNKTDLPPVLKCSENTSSSFLHNQMWDLAFWKVQERTPSSFPEWSLNLSGWFTLLSKCSPRPTSQLHFLWEACRYWVLKLATLPGILITS